MRIDLKEIRNIIEAMAGQERQMASLADKTREVWKRLSAVEGREEEWKLLRRNVDALEEERQELIRIISGLERVAEICENKERKLTEEISGESMTYPGDMIPILSSDFFRNEEIEAKYRRILQ